MQQSATKSKKILLIICLAVVIVGGVYAWQQKNRFPKPTLTGSWEAQFGNGELSGTRRYTFNEDGTFTMTGYPEINDSGTYTIVGQTGTSFKIELKTKTGYSPSSATITIQGNSLEGLDNVGRYQRVTS